MLRWVVILSAVVVLAAAGIAEVVQARRRADPEAAQQVQARLDAIPLTVGSWAGKVAAFNPQVLRQTNATAHTYRVYTKVSTGETLEVLMLAGDSGDIGVHDPERCYGGAGFRPVGSRRRVELTDPVTAQPVSYWSARFDTDMFPASSLQIAWAWTADGTWAASDDARFEFVGKPVLYKLYVTRRLAAGAKANADPTDEFLTDFLPEVRKCLASPAR
jgi:hypothetical protein